VLTPVVDDHAPKKIVELSERRYARPTVSRTFEDAIASRPPPRGWRRASS